MKGGIEVIAETICEDMRGLLPGQNKKQREGLALLTATMLDVRSANLMDLACRCLGRPNVWTCVTNGSAGFWAMG